MVESNSPAMRSKGITRDGRVWAAVTIVALTTLGLCGIWVRSSAVQTPDLRLASEYMDMGKIWLQHEFEWTMMVANCGAQDIKILDFDTSCICTKIDPSSLTIPARSERPVRLLLNLTSLAGLAGPLEHPVEVQVKPVVASCQVSIVWRIRGVIKKPFVAAPDRIQYVGAARIVRGAGLQAKEVILDCAEEVVDVQAEIVPALGTAVVSRPASSGDRLRIEFRPNSNLPVGSFSSVLRLTPTLGNQEQGPPVSLPIVGNVVPDVTAFPERLSLGVVKVGASVEREMLVASKSGRRFTLTPSTFSQAEISVEAREGGCSALHRLVFRVVPTKSGDQALKVTLAVCYEDGDSDEAELPVSYYGR